MKIRNRTNRPIRHLLIFFFAALVCVNTVSPTIVVAKTNIAETSHWTGDLDDLKQQGAIRVLVPVSTPFFLVDGFKKYGFIQDKFTLFEKFLNNEENKGSFLRVVMIPTSRDSVFERLIAGYGDVVAANLTITSERMERVDFANPTVTHINQVVVAAPNAQKLKSLDDLSGKNVYVRSMSSYSEYLQRLNKRFVVESKEPVQIHSMSEDLGDDLLLAMVNEELLDYTVVDQWKAELWHEMYPDYVLYKNFPLDRDGKIGWAIRNNSPQLKAVLNQFLDQYHENLLFDVKTSLEKSKKDMMSFSNLSDDMWPLFQKYLPLFERIGEKYDIPAPWLAGLAYVSSGYSQKKIGLQGEVGMMQLAPFIARSAEVDISDISQVEQNVEAAAKYLRYLIDTYFSEKDLDNRGKNLFAMAAYHVGPEKISTIRWITGQMGKNQNKWFNEVAVVVSRRMGRETERFVLAVSASALTYVLALESGKNGWVR